MFKLIAFLTLSLTSLSGWSADRCGIRELSISVVGGNNLELKEMAREELTKKGYHFNLGDLGEDDRYAKINFHTLDFKNKIREIQIIQSSKDNFFERIKQVIYWQNSSIPYSGVEVDAQMWSYGAKRVNTYGEDISFLKQITSDIYELTPTEYAKAEKEKLLEQFLAKIPDCK
jgi:hypothetical protein